MTITASHHFSTVAVVPPCEAEGVLVHLSSMAERMKSEDWKQIVSAGPQVEDFELVGDGFIGTIVAVGRDGRSRVFTAGDYVGGYMHRAKWVETLDECNTGVSDGVFDVPKHVETAKDDLRLCLVQIVYLNVPSNDLWLLPAATLKESGIVLPVTSGGCIVT
ncbi:hypothetical protein FRB97_007906 [Tulasnella sp. 331]|nr:hypothetical protein FRB97_007906 [Tulasnella sp. 331]